MKKLLCILLAVICLTALLVLPAAAADKITVYVTVLDNGSPAVGEDSGDFLVAYPVKVDKGATMDDVLRGLHAAECKTGPSGYKSESMSFYGQTTTYLSTWFGKAVDMNDGSTHAVSAWLNNNMNSTLTSKVRDGDRVDVLIYTVVSSQNYTYQNWGISWFDYYAVEAGVGETFSVGAWRNEMDAATFMWNAKPCTDMTVTVNGLASDFRVADDGNVTLRFDEPGEYCVAVGGNPSYGAAAMRVTVTEGASFTGMQPAGPGRMAASGLEDGGTGEGEVTAYVTVSDNGTCPQGEVSGKYLSAYPVTLPAGATLDDVLNAVNKAECALGEEGYSSSGMEMGGMVTYFIGSWFGKPSEMTNGSTTACTAWVGHDSASTLATPIQDGDYVNVCLYTVVDSAMFSFENYGLCYFDFPQAKAGVGESVTLHVYTEEMNFMSYQYNTKPLGNLSVTVNGEASDYTVDGSGVLTLSFAEPGEYCIVAGGDKTHGAAVMTLTVEEGAAFSDSSSTVDESAVLAANLSAPGNGTGPDITVYVTLTDKGGYVKSEVDDEYLIAVPVTVPGGSTVDDVLQAFNAQESQAGAMGYTSYKMDFYGSPFYSIATWFGKTVNSYDGSDFAVTAWLNQDSASTLANKVSEGDTINAIIYGVVSSMEFKYQNWSLSYFDYPQLKAGVGETVTLHAYHCSMDPTAFTWSNYVSPNLQVQVNGQARTETVGADGTLSISFDQPGTYYLLATGDETLAAAAVKITVEEGAKFSDNAPVATPDAKVPVVTRKADPAVMLKIAIIAVVAIIVIIALVRIIKNAKKKEDSDE